MATGITRRWPLRGRIADSNGEKENQIEGVITYALDLPASVLPRKTLPLKSYSYLANVICAQKCLVEGSMLPQGNQQRRFTSIFSC